MQINSSKVLDGYSLVIIYPNDPQYDDVKELFKRYGLALTDVKSNIFYVDGGAFDEEDYDNTHLTAIDAHESSHIILGHEGETDIPQEEIEADYLAILILKSLSQNESADILKDQFTYRHGMPFESAEEHIRPEVLNNIKTVVKDYFNTSGVEEIINEFFDKLITEKVEHAKMVLFEGRVDDAKKYALSEEMPEDKFQSIVQASKGINPNHKYLDWMTKRIIDEFGSDYIPTDVDVIYNKVVKPLMYFQNHFKEFTKRDINSYATTDDLIKAVQDLESKERRNFKEVVPGEKVFENEKVIIMAPSTIQSSCNYGAGTVWCTTQANQDYFKNYTKGGQLYYVLSKTKSTDDPTYKIAIRFEFRRSDVGYRLAEIRDAQNNSFNVSDINAINELFGDDLYNIIISDFEKRREIEININSYEKLKKSYQSDPIKFLKETPYELLKDGLKELGVISQGYELCKLLMENNIHPLTKKDIDIYDYFGYITSNFGGKTIENIIKFVDDVSEMVKLPLIEIFNISPLTKDDIVNYYKTKYSGNFIIKFTTDMLDFYENSDNDKFIFITFYGEKIDAADVIKEFNGIDNLIGLIKEKNNKLFHKMFDQPDSYALRIFFRNSIEGGVNILDIYNAFQKYKIKGYHIDIFKTITVLEWVTGFEKLYGENGMKELVPFLLKNSINIFEYLGIDFLAKYYGDKNKAIDAAKEYYPKDDDTNPFLIYFHDNINKDEKLDYLKSKNPEHPVAELISLYGDNIFDYFDVDKIENIMGEDFDGLLKEFTAAGLEETFLSNAGNLILYNYYVNKIKDKETTPENKLIYRGKAFQLANMGDVRMNGDGTVDLICNGYEDFIDWFYDGSIGYSGSNPKYVAKIMFSDDDFWEPFRDVVPNNEWYSTVWDNVNENNFQEVIKYMTEKVLQDNKITVDASSFDGEKKYASWIKKDNIDDSSFYLTKNRLLKISKDDLGSIIEENDDLEELKDNLKWAYEQAYNDASRDKYYNAYTEEIYETLSTNSEPRWENTGKKKKVTRKDGTFYEYDEQVFIIPKIGFFSLVKQWVDENIGYETEFQYNFIDTVQNYLSEYNDLLSPDPSEWPDDDVVEKYFNDAIVDRIYY
jgi:hypothetical protein